MHPPTGAGAGRGPDAAPLPGDRAAGAGLSRDLADFARRLDLRDCTQAAELFAISGGRPELAAAVIELGRRTVLPEDLAAPGFADVVAAAAAPPDLGLSEGDEWAVTVLAHLSAFTEETALLVLSAAASAGQAPIDLRDAEGLFVRLRMARALIPVSAPQAAGAAEAEGQRLLCVPALLAAGFRRRLAAGANAAGVIDRVLHGFVDHLESAESVDPLVLGDTLVLARRSGRWNVLARLPESLGLPVLLHAPAAARIAFAGLPSEALAAEPGLILFSRITDAVLLRLGGESRTAGPVDALVHETRLQRMSELLFASAPVGAAEVGGSVATIRAMTELAAAGRHGEALELGLTARPRPGATRARHMIRLCAAICAYHDGQLPRAVSLLHELETQAGPRHVDGDVLLPAALAWSALAATAGIDHERADRLLDRLGEIAPGPLVVDDLVRPARAAALTARALDRLDLESARTGLNELAEAEEDCGLSHLVPVLGRTLAILSAATESDLLFAEDAVRAALTGPVPPAAEDCLRASRSMVIIALGQLRWAETELARISGDAAVRVVPSVRIDLVAGRCESAIALARSWFYHHSLTPTSRAELAALKAAALARTGQDAEAAEEFRTAIGLSAWVSSLLPLALLPGRDRDRLLDLTADDPAWEAVLTALPAHFADRPALFARLREVGTVAVSETTLPQLSTPEAHLLELVAAGLTIPQLSAELEQVTGTVKNRLSALYRKFGVSSRAEMLARAGSLGFIALS